MFRFKTLFGRLSATYFLILMIALLLVLTLAGSGLRQQSMVSERNDMAQVAESVNQMFVDNYNSGGTGTQILQDAQQIADFEKYDIWIVDNYDILGFEITGNQELSEYSSVLSSNKETIAQTVMSGKSASVVSGDGGVLSIPVITYGRPIAIDGEVIGAVYVHNRLEALGAALGTFYQQTFLACAISVIAALFLVLFTARRIERPIYEINQAARDIAKADFRRRLDVKDKSEIGQLADTFNMMAAELEKYESSRQGFVANVSHELKSPLTSIQGFVQGILDGTIDKKEAPQYLEIVLSETKRLNLLIVDLLDLAKAESGQFPLHKTEWDVNELLRTCIIRFIGKIEEKNIELVVNVPDEKTMVFADMDRMTQVVTNLIDNAVKFCEESGTVKIWTYFSEGRVHVNIANTGEIIPEEDIPFVFDRFFKVDKSHNRKAPGTGIGLSIVKNIVVQHDEKIWVNSRKGTGTVFTFTLSPALKAKNSKN